MTGRSISLVVDGQDVAARGRRWLPLAAPPSTGALAVARRPGNPFGYAAVPARLLATAQARLIAVAETSRSM